MRPSPAPTLTSHLQGFEDLVARRLRQWRHDDVAARLVGKDPTLWSTGSPAELVDRLGWLDAPLRPETEISAIERFGEQIRADGYRHIAVLGMGGSSLAPEMFATTLPGSAGVSLEVLDSTHPSAVDAAAQRWDPVSTFFVVASKSGRTLETLSLYRFFRDWLAGLGRQPEAQMIAITDPGSELSEGAGEGRFRRVWESNPEVGGRYSALTTFGLVPAALFGVDIRAVMESARGARELLDGSVEERIELIRLGVILGDLAAAGVDKLTLLTGRGMRAFPAWLEQLIAESLGKRGRGIVPVAGEPLASAKGYDADRLFVSLELESEHNGALEESLRELEAVHPVVRLCLPEVTDLGYEIVRWEVAVAAAGSILGVHPFNQPDVEAAKELARQRMSGATAEQKDKDGLWTVAADFEQDDFSAPVVAWLKGAVRGGYFGIHAYLPASDPLDAAVRSLRAELSQSTRLATTFGYGPRFLHSTGQLHKGGPNKGLFLQLIDDASLSVEIPDSELDFGTVIKAQSSGDAAALFGRRQWVLRLHVGSDPVAAVDRLTRWLADQRRR